MPSPLPHVILVNLGTPEAPTSESVRAFLDEFLCDPAVVDLPGWLWRPILRLLVLPRRSERVAELYRSIWTPAGSPLRAATDRIVGALRRHGDGRFTASAAYRYGQPSLDTEMQRLAGDTSGPIIVVPLFPQRTDATTGTAFTRSREAAERVGIAHRVVQRVVAADDADYVAALAARWHEMMAGAAAPPEHLVVSFHGIPTRYNRREGREYTVDCEATTSALLTAIEWPVNRTTLAYQSKFGPEPWLKPATAAVLEELPHRGIKRVAVITPGFVTEGLETLEEIGIRGRESFLEAGGESLLRVGAVEEHDSFLRSLASLASA